MEHWQVLCSWCLDSTAQHSTQPFFAVDATSCLPLHPDFAIEVTITGKQTTSSRFSAAKCANTHLQRWWVFATLLKLIRWLQHNLRTEICELLRCSSIYLLLSLRGCAFQQLSRAKQEQKSLKYSAVLSTVVSRCVWKQWMNLWISPQTR